MLDAARDVEGEGVWELVMGVPRGDSARAAEVGRSNWEVWSRVSDD